MTPRLILVGASLGGTPVLRALLAGLPADFAAALLIVQHRVMEESGDLLPMLQRDCKLPIRFPLDKEHIMPGQVYIAPPNYHLLVEDEHFAYTLDAPENYARPSIDVLFESVAEACGARATGIIMTGKGRDGATGLAAIHSRGGVAIVQSPHDAFAPQMPLAALAAVPQARQMTALEIGQWLAGLMQ